jgi:ketosteroid isomerase-like protein
MSEHPNAEVVRRGYQAYGSGDLSTLREVLAGDLEWPVPGRSRFAGVFKGSEVFIDRMKEMSQLSQGSLKVQLLEVAATGDIVFTLHRLTGSRNGHDIDVPSVFVFHMRDGRIAQIWEHPHDLYEDDEFWD